MNVLEISLAIMLIIGICVYLIIFVISSEEGRFISGIILFGLIVILFLFLSEMVNKDESQYKFKAELKDGTIEYSNNCYEEDEKKICEFTEGSEMVVVDYWSNEDTGGNKND